MFQKGIFKTVQPKRVKASGADVPKQYPFLRECTEFGDFPCYRHRILYLAAVCADNMVQRKQQEKFWLRMEGEVIVWRLRRQALKADLLGSSTF